MHAVYRSPADLMHIPGAPNHNIIRGSIIQSGHFGQPNNFQI